MKIYIAKDGNIHKTFVGVAPELCGTNTFADVFFVEIKMKR